MPFEVSKEFLLDPDKAITTANDQVALANQYVADLIRQAGAFTQPIWNVNIDLTKGKGVDLTGIPDGLEFDDGNFSKIEAPDYKAPNTAAITFPTFSGAVPTFDVGTPPTEDFGSIPDMPPIAAVGGLPSLTLSLPPAPSLLSIDIANFDGVTLPTFEGGDVPELTLVRPSVVPYEPGDMYSSELLTTVRTSLQDRIANGGTGLNANIEQAIFDRARERELRTVQDAIDGLERMETMGFAFPPGVYLDSRLKIQTEYGKVEAGLSRDIMIKQAELELANVQEALKLAVTAEGQFMDYVSKVEQRIFDATKYATEAAVQIYNSEVQAYAARLDAYKTTVQIYEARIRGELAKVEVYKARVAAEQTKAEVNNAIVQQYKVRVDAALSAVEVYKAQVQGVIAAAQIEEIKVKAYAEQIKAYGTKANIFTARVEGYKARMQAEGYKVEAYKATVQAFAAQAEAAASQAQVAIAKVRADAEVLVASWEGYKAQAAAASSQAQAQAALNSAQASIFASQSQATSSYNQTQVAKFAAEGEIAGRTAEVAIAASKVQAELYVSMRSLAADASKVAAQVAAQIAAAALNTMNYSNSISVSSASTGSTSNSTSTSTNTNINI